MPISIYNTVHLWLNHGPNNFGWHVAKCYRDGHLSAKQVQEVAQIIDDFEAGNAFIVPSEDGTKSSVMLLGQPTNPRPHIVLS